MKLAACFTPPGQPSAENATRMGRAQALRPEHAVRTFEVMNGALASVTTADRFSSVPLARRSTGGNVLLISGVPLDLRGSLDTTLADACEQDYRHAADVVASLDGAYAALFWDQANAKLVIVSDILGMQPLYFSHASEGLLVATELKAFGAAASMHVAPDPAGWGAFISFGHFIGPRTSIAGVRPVPPGSVMVYDPADRTLSTQPYWQWPERRPLSRLEEVDTGAMLEALEREIHGYGAHHRSGNLLLSGGFDSRLVLALLARQRTKPKGVIVRYSDENHDADARLAVHAAREVRADYHVFTPPISYYSSSHYVDYLLMNEAATPSLELFVVQIASYVTQDLEAIWEGVYPGCILSPLQKIRGGFRAYLQKACKSAGSSEWNAAALVFNRAFLDEMLESFSQVLKEETSKYPDDDDGVTQFVVRNRTRHRTAPNPLKVYANDALPFTPGLSRDFWELAARVPTALKHDHRLYFEIFRRHLPALGAIPFLSAGALHRGTSGRTPLYFLETARRGLGRTRVGARALREMGVRFGWEPSAVLARVLADVSLDDPRLNADHMRGLRQDTGTADPIRRRAQHLLFYWQVWKWVMDGRSAESHRHRLRAATA